MLCCHGRRDASVPAGTWSDPAREKDWWCVLEWLPEHPPVEPYELCRGTWQWAFPGSPAWTACARMCLATCLLVCLFVLVACLVGMLACLLVGLLVDGLIGWSIGGLIG